MLEHRVSRRMPECIVDAFETVQTDEYHRYLSVVATGLGQTLGQAIAQQRTVGQFGEHSVMQQS
ncbi:hypothetical protein D3C85_1837170 [compost metagenome]